MYSQKAWGGSVDPFILTKFVTPKDIPEDQDPIVSFVLFEWNDRELVGLDVSGGSEEVREIWLRN